MAKQLTFPLPNKLTQRELGSIYFDRLKQSVTREGWLKSAVEKRALDRTGEPCPWYTYPALHFIAERILPSWKIFEYGSGQSTLWWGARVARVIAVEHHKGWADHVASQAPRHVTIVHLELEYGGDYGREILQHELAFDVVIIDGRDRNHCAKSALERISPKGVFIWDNSDRPRYQDGYDMLKAVGFRRIDFHGRGPVNINPWMTSIFYRSDNVMGI
jgi:hypothetical protein